MSKRQVAMVWIERVVLAGMLLFVFARVGPQFGALLGVGPDLGRAPDYSLVTLDGTPVSAESLHGKVVVVNFWATWCGPCKLEMPSLEKVHRERAGEDLVILGLSTDVGDVEGIRQFLSERDITFPVGRATGRLQREFGGVPAIPTTYIIDRSGVVRHRVVGYFAPPALRAAVDRLLAEAPSDATAS